MADIEVKKINQLPLAGILDLSNDILALEQGGIAKKIPIATLRQNNASALDTGTVADERLPTTAARTSRTSLSTTTSGWWAVSNMQFSSAGIIKVITQTNSGESTLILAISASSGANPRVTILSAGGQTTNGPLYAGGFIDGSDYYVAIWYPTSSTPRTLSCSVVSNISDAYPINPTIFTVSATLSDIAISASVRYNRGIKSDISSFVNTTITNTFPTNIQLGETISYVSDYAGTATITAPAGVYDIVGAHNIAVATGGTFNLAQFNCVQITRRS